MSAAPELRADDDILTPTVRRFLRRSLFWIGIVTIIVIIAGVGLAFSGSALSSGEPLNPEDPAPNGTKALVEVLRHEGVDVTITSSLDDTDGAIDDDAGTTLVVNDAYGDLTESQWRRVAGLADTLVLVDPGYVALSEIAPDVLSSGRVDDVELDADCRLDAAEAAGTISGEGSGFRTLDSAIASCFDSGDDVYSLVQVDYDGTLVTVLGATESLTNGRIVENGNAALALWLLGSQPKLVWYTPGLDDLDDVPATVADFSPDWLVPVMLTLVLVFIAAAVWRGRRFGPLIVENLPVTVRASETMIGRARLYQRSSVRLHAIDSLRIGALDRLARLLGLPRLATVDEVVTSVARVVGRDERELRMLLIDAVPQNDAELIALSDQLLLLEDAVTRRLRPQ